MIRIALAAAYDAVTSTLPLSSVGYANKTNEQGDKRIWLDRAVVDRLRSQRGAGENCSDVILRIDERQGGRSLRQGQNVILI